MLLEADVETARTVLMRAAAKFLSNEAPNLEDVTSRFQERIACLEVPKGTGYRCYLWQGELSPTLVHTGFPNEMQRKWEAGIDWPSWDQIIAAIPEMICARIEIDLTTGFPFRLLRGGWFQV